MKLRSVVCLLTIMLTCLRPALAKDRSDKIRVLILDGFSNHDWRQSTLLLREVLDEAREFEVNVSTMPAKRSAAWADWRPEFAAYDVVIQTCNDNGGNGELAGVKELPEWPEAVKNEFVKYVRNGGGVYIFHSAENAFLGWKEYEQMVGLSWRSVDYGTAIGLTDAGKLVRIPPGVGRGTGHGPRGNVLITRLGNDPIHKGIPRAWLSPGLEVYYYARGPAEHLRVLAYARDDEPGLRMLWPMEWTTTFGKGRIYISTYGHVRDGDVQPASMRGAAVQTIIPRALEWLAGRPVIFPVPKDFPNPDAVSVRVPTPLPSVIRR